MYLERVKVFVQEDNLQEFTFCFWPIVANRRTVLNVKQILTELYHWLVTLQGTNQWQSSVMPDRLTSTTGCHPAADQPVVDSQLSDSRRRSRLSAPLDPQNHEHIVHEGSA
jgi:hypothetical protein